MAKKEGNAEGPRRIVLVGTYRGDQLKDWPGWYCWPLDDDVSAAKAAKGEGRAPSRPQGGTGSPSEPPEWLPSVTELWLYKGTADERRCRAEFVGVKTREELIRDYGYPGGDDLSHAEAQRRRDGRGKRPACPKPHGTHYALFKTELIYRHKNDLPGEADAVIVRLKDFARTPKVRKQLREYLESPDRNDPDLSNLLPSIITSVPPERLKVCEAAVQLNFWADLFCPIRSKARIQKTSRPIGIDLFAGCGGLSLGFEQAGFDIVAAVEIDPIHAAVHEYNFPDCKTICSDIRNIDGNDIRRLAGIGDCDVDVVFGGAPCQGFSMIGKRALDDPRNQLISHYLRIVNDIRPKYCVLENVKGLTVGKHVQFLTELIDELKNIHYKVLLPYRVLNAADYGVPQNRQRLFLIAAREDQQLPDYPLPIDRKVTVEEAISDIPDADRFEGLLSDDSVQVRWNTMQPYARQLRGQSPDASNFGYERIFDSNQLTASLRTIHGDLSKQRFINAPQGETEPHSRFFKLAWNGQSNTLRAGTDSARGGFTSPRPIHPTLPRVITVREAARIHSYPDWFRFNKTKWHGFREIGNSVPPKLARAVGGEIVKALGIKPVKPAVTVQTGDEALLGFDMSAAAEYFCVPRNVIAQRKRRQDAK